MAGRSHLPPDRSRAREVYLLRDTIRHESPSIEDLGIPNRRPHHSISSPVPALTRSHHTDILEVRVAAQKQEIQSLISDNQRLASAHVALKHEIAAVQQELRLLSATAGKVKAERDAVVREVYERSLKMDSEVRAVDVMKAELVQVQEDVQKLNAIQQKLTFKLPEIEADLKKASSNLQRLHSVKADVETMHHEIQRGRAAIEFEKKTHISNLEHKHSMEKSMISMTNELQKLQAELADAEKRGRAAAAANPPSIYAPSYGNPDISYAGNFSADTYGIYQGIANYGVHYNHGAVAVAAVQMPYVVQPPQQDAYVMQIQQKHPHR